MQRHSVFGLHGFGLVSGEEFHWHLPFVDEFLGALAGTAVATTMAAGLVDSNFVSLTTILCALLAAIFWNLLTWWFGLPSSSSHALIGVVASVLTLPTTLTVGFGLMWLLKKLSGD